MAELRLESINKTFDNKVAVLRDFNLHVKDAEFLTILGPSGVGKSTILRIIAGLEQQDSGRVFIGKQCVDNLAPQKRDIAFVFQNYALYPHMNVYDNIATSLKLQKFEKSEIDSQVSKVCELLEIKNLIYRRPKTLSGGQQQRVALARAIAKRPKLFLLDEPLSNLDAILREKMRVELKILFKRIKGTVVYVTHDQTEAMSLSDRVAIVNESRLVAVGTNDELIFDPPNLFTAHFMGINRVNYFDVSVRGRKISKGNSVWNIPFTVKGYPQKVKKAIFAIRPNYIDVCDAPEGDFFPAEILASEIMGEQIFLTVKWEGVVLKIQLPREKMPKVQNRQIYIKFNSSKAFLFDPASRKAMR
jgi:multiple sugar transport system ATP-binding protein